MLHFIYEDELSVNSFDYTYDKIRILNNVKVYKIKTLNEIKISTL